MTLENRSLYQMFGVGTETQGTELSSIHLLNVPFAQCVQLVSNTGSSDTLPNPRSYLHPQRDAKFEHKKEPGFWTKRHFLGLLLFCEIFNEMSRKEILSGTRLS